MGPESPDDFPTLLPDGDPALDYILLFDENEGIPRGEPPHAGSSCLGCTMAGLLCFVVLAMLFGAIFYP
jgi:hypothetical protein